MGVPRRAGAAEAAGAHRPLSGGAAGPQQAQQAAGGGGSNGAGLEEEGPLLACGEYAIRWGSRTARPAHYPACKTIVHAG